MDGVAARGACFGALGAQLAVEQRGGGRGDLTQRLFFVAHRPRFAARLHRQHAQQFRIRDQRQCGVVEATFAAQKTGLAIAGHAAVDAFAQGESRGRSERAPGERAGCQSQRRLVACAARTGLFAPPKRRDAATHA